MNEELISNSERDSLNKTKILLADNFPLVRQALRIFIEKEKDLEVIADASDGLEVLDIVTKVVPDVIILEADMPKITGLEVTKQVLNKYPKVKMLILADIPGDEQLIGMLKAGASGYVMKNVSAEEIIHALRVVIGGEEYLPYTVFQNTTQDYFHGNPRLIDNLNKLTSRELRILRFMATGMSNKDIANKLDLSERSVKHNITVIFTKLNVSSRTEAIAMGLKTRLLHISDF